MKITNYNKMDLVRMFFSQEIKYSISLIVDGLPVCLSVPSFFDKLLQECYFMKISRA